MKLKEKLIGLKAAKKAILAANFYNYETLIGILNAAAQHKYPVILQLSESSINYLGLNNAVALAKSALDSTKVEGWLHLDHGNSLKLAEACINAGFDSVMIDASEKPFDENVRITKEAVKMASKLGINVEAELGYVAKLGQQFNKAGFTTADDAKKFVMLTEVDALAVAIGSVHGFYKEAPKLDIPLLREISVAIPTPLVLHGSSGIPDAMLQEAIRNGITKVNLATETKNIFMQTLKQNLISNDEIDLRKVFPKAINAVSELISHKLLVLHNA